MKKDPVSARLFRSWQKRQEMLERQPVMLAWWKTENGVEGRIQVGKRSEMLAAKDERNFVEMALVEASSLR